MHPTLKRMQAWAEFRGSSAKTVKGILAYFKKYPPRKFDHSNYESASDWKARQKLRKADPEAKRAVHDKKFRKAYLAKLRREEKKLTSIAPGIDGWVEYRKTIEQSEKRLCEIARLREIVTGKYTYRKPKRTVQVVPIDGSTAFLARAPIVRRGKNAVVYAHDGPFKHVYEPGQTHWKNGKPKRYDRAVNNSYVRSIAYIESPEVVDYLIHEKRGTCKLSPGYKWDVDENGLRVVDVNNPKDDYHVEAFDLYKGAKYIIERFENARELRKTHAAKAAIERAKLAGVYVSFADSLRAGNCAAGTRSFAKKHGLDLRKHYPAVDLVEIANGNADRVRMAVNAATRRHREELAQGFCEVPKI